MSATGLMVSPEGTITLESFDYRTTTFYSEYCEWVVRALDAELRPHGLSEGVAAYRFDWEGVTFRLAYTDENGCHIEGKSADRPLLERMQDALAAAVEWDDDED